WCNSSLRRLLSAALGLTQRYLLYRAARLQPPSGRTRALAYRKNSEALLGIDLLIIGQKMATWLLKRTILSHLAMPSSEPLVLLFAGPSGHGKTELARKFGDLMSLEHHFVDCTMFSREDELFGPKPPYQGYQAGSPLNNFLARMSGSKSVVFMDEFEKSKKEVWNTLLIPFDQGEYMDRRTASKVDCTQTIWILATNQFDPTIHEFCKRNKQALLESPSKALSTLLGKPVDSLRKECLSHFGAPLTGRISEIIPFVTFSPDEAAIVADRRIMEIEARVALGNVRLDVLRDSMVCSNIAENYYLPELGARSIFGGVKRVIERKLIHEYLEAGDDLSENQPTTRFTVNVNEEEEIEVLLS
ncbi:P-loop containing nucleoside triphosphate hydrolase protein, partial [Xylaria arbuscula]